MLYTAERKLSDFEESQRIASKSKLSSNDVKLLSLKAEKDFARHAKRLLNENNKQHQMPKLK